MSKFPRAGPRGFSLVEVLISIAVLSVGILGVMAAITYGNRAMHVGSRQAQAIDFARKIMDLVRIRNLAFNNNWPTLPAMSVYNSSGVYQSGSGVRDTDPSTGTGLPLNPTNADMKGFPDLNSYPFDTGEFTNSGSRKAGDDATGFKRRIMVEHFKDTASAAAPASNDWRYEAARITVTVYFYEKAQIGNEGSKLGSSSSMNWKNVTLQSVQSRP